MVRFGRTSRGGNKKGGARCPKHLAQKQAAAARATEVAEAMEEADELQTDEEEPRTKKPRPNTAAQEEARRTCIIIEHNGGLVPDAVIHRNGCSRTKRKGKRAFEPSAQVSVVIKERCQELRAHAKCMVEGGLNCV